MKILNRICLIALTLAAVAIIAMSLFGIKALVAFTVWVNTPETVADFNHAESF